MVIGGLFVLAQGLGAFSSLSRGLRGTKMMMIWERLLPAIAPYFVWAALLAVAGQWGLFNQISLLWHLVIILLGLLVCASKSVQTLKAFKVPSFTEINTRLAKDNGLKPEYLLALRHQIQQPKLKVGKAKAGIAQADPFALRILAVLLAALGYLIHGPVPLAQIRHGVLPLETLPPPSLRLIETKSASVQSANIGQASETTGVIKPVAN